MRTLGNHEKPRELMEHSLSSTTTDLLSSVQSIQWYFKDIRCAPITLSGEKERMNDNPSYFFTIGEVSGDEDSDNENSLSPADFSYLMYGQGAVLGNLSIRHGSLLIQSQSDPHLWRKRLCLLVEDWIWCIIDPQRRVSNPEGRNNRIMAIALKDCTGVELLKKGSLIPHGFRLSSGNKHIYFQAQSQSEQRGWVSDMARALFLSEDNKNIMFADMIIGGEEEFGGSRYKKSLDVIFNSKGMRGIATTSFRPPRAHQQHQQTKEEDKPIIKSEGETLMSCYSHGWSHSSPPILHTPHHLALHRFLKMGNAHLPYLHTFLSAIHAYKELFRHDGIERDTRRRRIRVERKWRRGLAIFQEHLMGRVILKRERRLSKTTISNSPPLPPHYQNGEETVIPKGTSLDEDQVEDQLILREQKRKLRMLARQREKAKRRSNNDLSSSPTLSPQEDMTFDEEVEEEWKRVRRIRVGDIVIPREVVFPIFRELAASFSISPKQKPKFGWLISPLSHITARRKGKKDVKIRVRSEDGPMLELFDAVEMLVSERLLGEEEEEKESDDQVGEESSSSSDHSSFSTSDSTSSDTESSSGESSSSSSSSEGNNEIKKKN